MEQEASLLESLQLANNLSVSMYDLSRKVAADRWLVRVRCVASTGLPDHFFEQKLKEDDHNLVAEIKEKFQGNLSHEVIRELNFVDQSEKNRSVLFLMDSLRENCINYMGRESFLEKLLAKQYNEFKQEILTRREFGLPEEDDEGKDEGPADFSACFRD